MKIKSHFAEIKFSKKIWAIGSIHSRLNSFNSIRVIKYNEIALYSFGFSNLKIILILSSTAFIFGVFVLLLVNPLTSTMIKFYEETKAQYSKDIDHLVSINKNGVWIKEIYENNLRITTAKKVEKNFLHNVTIYELDKDTNKIL